MAELEITRHFRRDYKQEYRMGSRVQPAWIVGLVIAGVALAYWTRVGEVIDWGRMLGYPALLLGVYALVKIGNAQIRARAQPFYHTLKLREGEIEVVDQLRGRTARYPWRAFERVEITPHHFTIRRRDAPRGEEYLIRRDKLSEAEQRFLGERLVELAGR